MTFEQWWEEDTSHIDIYRAAKSAWNAAIASSLIAVDAVIKQRIDENDVVVYIHEDLKKLLTDN